MKIKNNGARPISKVGITIAAGETLEVTDERAMLYFLTQNCTEVTQKAKKKAPAREE